MGWQRIWKAWIEKNGKRVSDIRFFSERGLEEQVRRFKENGYVPGLRMVFEVADDFVAFGQAAAS